MERGEKSAMLDWGEGMTSLGCPNKGELSIKLQKPEAEVKCQFFFILQGKSA